MEISRRNLMRGSVAALIGSGAGAALPATAKTTRKSNSKGCFYLTELLNNPAGNDVTISKQVGVNYVIATNTCRGRKEQYMESVRAAKEAWAKVGMEVAGVEGPPWPFENLKAGTDQADAEIENTKWAIEALSRNGINMVCYNFMAGVGWTRTNQSLPDRGGALTSEFDLEDTRKMPLTRFGEISEEKMWKTIEKFMKEVMPVADKFKMKMALHPDDPPLSPLRGVARVVTSKRNYERIMAMAPSPYNGVTFCQANFKLMKEDIYSLAKEWCNRKKIFFVHFRDVDGDVTKFRETFHDNGPTDMIRMLEIYSKGGFVGPIRPDHAPALAGEAQNGRASGYTIGGKVLAFGYMKGIMDTLGLKYV